MNFKPREGNLAQSLGGYLWAVSSLVGEKMQIRCLQENTHRIDHTSLAGYPCREWL